MSRESTAAVSEARRVFVVEEREAGWRLDAWLAAALGASRAQVRRELARGSVCVGGRPVDLRAKGRPLVAGTRIEVTRFAAPAARAPLAEADAPLRVVAEGRGWVAVDKPAGTPVHPLDPEERGTVLNALVARRPEMLGVGEGGLRCGVVHRLDVDTSGVLLFATDAPRFAALRGAFRRHRVAKTYRALVAGRLEGEGDLVLHLAVAQHRPARVRVVAEDDPQFGRRTRRTRMAWRALSALEDATLVELRPRTGFLHQIRVSLAHLGHPVLGDATYRSTGPPGPVASPPAPPVPRHMLHASRVAWGEIDVQAPDPPDFAGLLARLGGAAAGPPPT